MTTPPYPPSMGPVTPEALSLRIDQSITDLKLSLNQRFGDLGVLLNERFVSQTTLLDERFGTQTKSLDKAFEAAALALATALKTANETQAQTAERVRVLESAANQGAGKSAAFSQAQVLLFAIAGLGLGVLGYVLK